jgi:hypothetical protein
MLKAVHVDLPLLFIGSPYLLHLVLLSRFLFNFLKLVVIVQVLCELDRYDVIVAIAWFAVDGFVVADA